MASSDYNERVYTAIETAAGADANEDVTASWCRSRNDYRVDPASLQPPTVLSQSELKDFRDPAERLIEAARGELNQLYSVVRDSGYVVLLCDANGIAIDHRGNETDSDQFKFWGIWRGGVWSEEIEGTNGIGTCVNLERPVAVHREQHFRARHGSLSCSGAPIFAPDGSLAGVLDVSSFDPAKSEQAHALTLPITSQAARAIELRLFRQHFSRSWITALSRHADDGAAIIVTMAVDADQRIVGADRDARQAFELDGQALRDGASLWTYFERDAALFRAHAGEDIAAHLKRRSEDASWRVIVTPPASRLRGNSETAAIQFRPRLAALADIPPARSPHVIHGGLSPSVLRRVQDYVDANLHENISLEAMASVAGLSLWHFARTFAQAVGMPPHRYVLQRRIERAREMLAATDLPLSNVALSVGFADHSHFSRHFRRLTGMTPGQMRQVRTKPDA